MSSPGRSRTSFLALLAAAGGVGLAGIAAARWWKAGTGPDGETGSASAARPLSVVISGDTAGWIVPCGCTSNQSGGLPRLGRFVRTIARDRDVVLLDVGGSPGGVSPYDREKFIAIVKGKQKMGLAVHNVGAPELALGIDELRAAGRKLGAPFVSANLRNRAGEQAFEAAKLVDAGGRRLLVAGVISPRFATKECQISSPADAVLSAVETFRGRYDDLIVLAYLPEGELRQLAADVPEADVVAGGPTGQSIAPQAVGPALLTAATNKGKFAAHLRRAGETGVARWSGEIIELDASFKDDPEQLRNLDEFYAVLEARDFAAEETGFVPPQPVDPPAGYRIAGSESCRDCHESDAHAWDVSAHPHAWKTLIDRGAQVDSDCQRCHTTGFGLPGGFVSAKRSADRVGVGCESCHGPSRGHVDNPEMKTAFAARDFCIRCHDRENSPQFEFASYWDRIRHGGGDSRPESAP